jgi:hypothetical protein
VSFHIPLPIQVPVLFVFLLNPWNQTASKFAAQHVALPSEHDLADATDAGPFVTAAFELASSCAALWASGLQNWTALPPPSQEQAHGHLAQAPLP